MERFDLPASALFATFTGRAPISIDRAPGGGGPGFTVSGEILRGPTGRSAAGS